MPYRFRKNGNQGHISPQIVQRIPARESMAPSVTEREPDLFAEQSSPTRTMMQFVLDHPGACLSTALAVGVFVGWLIKRK
jgi:hypothetical protein